MGLVVIPTTFLVKATLRERLSNAHKNQGRKKKRWNIDKLKYEEELNLYQQRINENLKETVESQDVQIEWNKIKWNKIKKCDSGSSKGINWGEDGKKK